MNFKRKTAGSGGPQPLTRTIGLGDIRAENEEIRSLASVAASDPVAPFGSSAWGENREDNFANLTRRSTEEVIESLRSDVIKDNELNREFIARAIIDREQLEADEPALAERSTETQAELAKFETEAKEAGHEVGVAAAHQLGVKWSILSFFVVLEAIAISAAMRLFGFSDKESYVVSGGLTLSQTIFGDYLGTAHQHKRVVESLDQSSPLYKRLQHAAPDWQRARRLSWAFFATMVTAGTVFGVFRAIALEDVSTTVRVLAIFTMPVIAVVPALAALAVSESFGSPVAVVCAHLRKKVRMTERPHRAVVDGIVEAKQEIETSAIRIYDREAEAERLIEAMRHRAEEKIQLYRYYFFQALDETYTNQMFPVHHHTVEFASVRPSAPAAAQSGVAAQDPLEALLARASRRDAPTPGGGRPDLHVVPKGPEPTAPNEPNEPSSPVDPSAERRDA